MLITEYWPGYDRFVQSFVSHIAFLAFLLAVGAVIFGWLAAITKVLQPYAPLSWVVSGFVGAILISVLAIVAGAVWQRYFPSRTGRKEAMGHSPDNAAPYQSQDSLIESVKLLENRLKDIEKSVGNILHRQTEHISTPQLRIELEREIQESEVRAGVTTAEVFRKLDEADKAIIDRLVNVHNHHNESKHFMSAQIDYINQQLSDDYTDIKYLLIYVSRNLDIRLIDLIIDWYPTGGKPIIELPDDAQRKARANELQQYIMKARSDLLNSWLNDLLPQTLKDAELEAEMQLKLIPQSQRPQDTDQIDLLRYMVTEMQAKWLVMRLAAQREEAEKGLRGQRKTIERRLIERQSPRKVSVPVSQ